MTTSLVRRIQKIEKLVAPRRQDQGIVTLFAPKEDAPPEEWSRHRAEIEKARKQKAQVIVVSPAHTKRTPGAPGVMFVPNEFEALVERLSLAPSERGNKSALVDAFQDLSGDVFGPTADGARFARDDDDEAD